MTATPHIPVLLKETISLLAVKSGGRYVDGTFGRGGHSRAIAAAGGDVLGIDRDDDAIDAAGDIKVIKGCHGDLAEIAERNGWNEVDGILLDLGVSSPQLDEAGRGFSFLREGPLDMRMDRTGVLNAADVVNGESEDELARIFRTLGDEREDRRIARAIARARCSRRIATTTELAAIVEKAVGRHGAHHPATRVFQALRMHVNDEVGELERALEGGIGILKPNGRFAVITFESITDRIVKRFFAEHTGRNVSLQQGGERWEGRMPRAVSVVRHAVTAGEEELKLNPRSRSAKLRVIERSE